MAPRALTKAMLTPPNTNERTSPDVADLAGQLQANRSAFLDFLRHRLRSGADAEDLLQQGLLVATGKLDQLRDPDSLVPWFYRILRRLLADHHAQWATREGKLHLLEVEVTDDDEVAICGCALGLLAQLKPEDATLIERVDLNEQLVVDVARELAITPGTAAVRLHRARKALREGLRRCCGLDSLRAAYDCTCDEETRS